MVPESRRFAIDASVPTSRAAFRSLAKSVGATNRQADSLRSALLAEWASGEGPYELECRLRDLDASQPDGTHDLGTLLAVWFSFGEAVDGKIVDAASSVLDGMPDPIREALAAIDQAE